MFCLFAAGGFRPKPSALTNNNNYSFTAVGGARTTSGTRPDVSLHRGEGAENGSNYVTIEHRRAIPCRQRCEGVRTYSFHFCMPDATDQSLTFNASIRRTPTASLPLPKAWLAERARFARAGLN